MNDIQYELSEVKQDLMVLKENISLGYILIILFNLMYFIVIICLMTMLNKQNVKRDDKDVI